MEGLGGCLQGPVGLSIFCGGGGLEIPTKCCLAFE